MQNLSSPAVIRDIMTRHGFHFSKALGQNFIVNPAVCPKMAEMAGAAPGVGVIEIGTGIGVLTAELAARADKVVAIEVDKRLLPVLSETLADFDNITIINEDVLKVDLHHLIAEQFAGMEVIVCANLPYYITSPIIMTLLEEHLPICSITVMVQKEAAQRLTALPGTRAVGAVSLAVRYYCEPQVLFPVSRGSFLPPPDVDSAVIRLDLLCAPPVSIPDEACFFRIVKAAFSQRRKTLANSLASGLSLSKPEVQALLQQAEIRPNARAEELSMEQYGALCRAYCVNPR